MRLIILGANESIYKLILKANMRDIETYVFSWNKFEPGAAISYKFYNLSVDQKDEILSICRKINPNGVISITSDFTMPNVNFIARELNLISNSLICDFRSRNKYAMRKSFLESGLSVPEFNLVSQLDELGGLTLTYPLIVKPTDRWSSIGVSLISDKTKLNEFVLKALQSSIESKAIIESFISGSEYSAECISFNGQHKVLAFTQKFTSGPPNFFEIGHLQPAIIDESLKFGLINTIFTGLDSLDIKYGASHVEFMITDEGEIILVEIGARMGGDSIGTDLVNLSTGIDFIDLVIDVSLGINPLNIEAVLDNFSIIKYIINNEDVNQLEIIKNEYKEFIRYISPVIKIFDDNFPNGSNRLGEIVLSGKKEQEKELNEIIKLLFCSD